MREGARFVLNGLVATAVHYAVLTMGMEVWALGSAGLASFLASCAGITVSFLGNRYFVFRKTGSPVWGQALRFVLLYAAITLLTSGVMHLWADVQGWSYQAGFVVTLFVQVLLSYAGNRLLVFRAAVAPSFAE